MGHYQQSQFVSIASRRLAKDWTGLKVVEIGSYSVNSTIRPLFAGSQYTGVDLVAGEGVDLVAPGDEVALPDASIDLAISCECFEHNPRWVETFRNMHRMTMPGGVVLITCASTGRREHGTARTTPGESPGTTARGWDYYGNLTREDFERHLPIAQMFERHAFYRNDVSKDLYFIGQRAGAVSRLSDLDLGALWVDIDSVNTLVARDEPFRTRRLFGRLLELPLKLAERLPERSYQEVALRWPAVERSIKARFSRRK
jgi:SAM-dependent methyltransferase